MPPELSAINSGLPQVFDVAGKAPISSAAPVSPMTQVPQYATSTTMQPISGGFQVPSFQAPNTSSSASLLLMQQKAPAISQPRVQFMPQAGYANCYPTISASYQPSASFIPVSSNNGWSGQLPVQHAVQQNYQVAGIQQGHMQASFQNQASAAQPMDPF
jgi:hypothetical protein